MVVATAAAVNNEGNFIVFPVDGVVITVENAIVCSLVHIRAFGGVTLWR
tara:strand:+ start:53063 stop:53209 length:147 start_codon:yes stop_codon:yes gene_type:complete